MEDKKLTEQLLQSGVLTQSVVQAAHNMGVSPTQIQRATGLDPAVVNRALESQPPTELIAEVEATLPAKLYSIARRAAELVLTPGKMEEMSGPDLMRALTYALHNARLMQNKSTSNVSTISHYLHRINQPPARMDTTDQTIQTEIVREEAGKMVRTQAGEVQISPTTGQKRKSSNTILPEDPVIMAERAPATKSPVQTAKPPAKTPKPKPIQTMVKGKPVGRPYYPKAQVPIASSQPNAFKEPTKPSPSDALADLLTQAPARSGAIPAMPPMSPRIAPNVYDPDSDGGSL